MKNRVNLKCYMHFAVSQIKVALAYRMAFFVRLLSNFFTVMITYYLWRAIYQSGTQEIIGGFSFREMTAYVVIRFFSTFILTCSDAQEVAYSIQDGRIDHFFTDYLWTFTRITIREGAFDRYLLRPINPLFQILVERCQPDGLGEVAVGVLLTGYAATRLKLTITGILFPVFLIAVVAGAVIYTSVKLFFASNAFFMKECYGFLYTAYNMSDFAKYPTEIYSAPVRIVISWILPFAFMAFIPAEYFLSKRSVLTTIGAGCPVAAAAFIISYSYFKFGCNHYESAGN